jgi:hypothetical protein
VRRSLAIGFALLLLVAAAAAGCGGDGDSSSDESSNATAASDWADSVCTALSDWQDELQQIGSSITDDPSSISRDTLEQAATDASDATDNLLETLRDIGAPDTESGQEAEQLIDTLADDLQQDLDDAEAAVEEASGFTGIISAIGEVTTAFTSAGSAIASTFDDLRALDADDELRQALEDNETCQSL